MIRSSREANQKLLTIINDERSKEGRRTEPTGDDRDGGFPPYSSQ